MTGTVWCDDWGCPARVSCALHFGRSAAYAAMRRARTRARPRPKHAGSCPDYRRDRRKPWLERQPGQATHGGEGS